MAAVPVTYIEALGCCVPQSWIRGTERPKIDIKSNQVIGIVDYMLQCLIPKWAMINVAKHFADVIPDSKRGYCTRILTGSSADGLYVPKMHSRDRFQGSPAVVHEKRSDHPLNDKDVMSTWDTCSVGRPGDPETHLICDTSETAPGYLRIKHIPSMHPAAGTRPMSLSSTCEQLKDGRFQLLHGENLETFVGFGPMQSDACAQWLAEISSDVGLSANLSCKLAFNGPAATIVVTNEEAVADGAKVVCSFDIAIAIKCQVWPDEAREWKERPRSSGWPSHGTIEKITQDGCHLVKVHHWRSTKPEIEWRFSFVCAEKELTKSLSEKHKQCYRLFKCLITNVLSPHTALSSYCLKTVFFWTLEKIPHNTFDSPLEGIGTVFLALLDELITRLAQQNIPQYFIPENNLLSNRHPDFIRAICRKIVHFRRNPIATIKAIDDVYECETTLPVPFPTDFLAINGTAQVRESYLCLLNRILNLRMELLLWYTIFNRVNSFCDLLDEILAIHPAFDWLSKCQQNISGYTYRPHIVGSYMVGFAWCGYIYEINKAEGDAKGCLNVDKYRHLINLAMPMHLDPNIVTLSQLYLSLIEQKCGRTVDAIGRLREITNNAQRLPGGSDKTSRWVVESSVEAALDTGLQLELCFTAVGVYPFHPLARYLLFRCYMESGQYEDATQELEILEFLCATIEVQVHERKLKKLQQYVDKDMDTALVESPDAYTVQCQRCVLGLLGLCYLLINDVDKALLVFRSQYDISPDRADDGKPLQLYKIIAIKRAFQPSRDH